MNAPMFDPLGGPLPVSDPMPVRCLHCLDTGHVCEDHPEFPWAGLSGPVEGHRDCGAAGQPCGYCCTPIPEDGTHAVGEAFTPGWRRVR